jgi:perosamine synthetase
MPCDVEAIVAIARDRGLPVVEDAACAVGSEILVDGRWERVGKPHGDVACFSFHPRKLLTTGDGGMITTNDAAWDAQFRLLRQHGMNVPDTVRHGAGQVIFESYPILGFNYRLTDIQAAVGREQLKRIPSAVARRREQVAYYLSKLEGIEGIALPIEPSWARSNWQSFCIRLDGRDQRCVMEALLEDGVSSRRGIMCAHREPAYTAEPWSCGAGPGGCGCPEGSCARLVESERAQDSCIILPLYDDLAREDQDAVVAALEQALGRCACG